MPAISGAVAPIMALVISAAFESFRWQVLPRVSIAVSVFGSFVTGWEQRQALERGLSFPLTR